MKVYAYTELRHVFARPTGVGKHVVQMFHGLARRPGVDLRVLTTADQLTHEGAMEPGHPLGDLPVTAMPFPRKRAELGWTLAGRPVVDPWCPEADWVYCPMEKPLATRRHRLAATFHSLYWFDPVLPQYHSWNYRRTRLRLGMSFRRLVRQADLLLTVSEFLKRQMVEMLGADEARIVVVGNGAEREFFEAGQAPAAVSSAATGGDGRPYVVVVSGLNDLDGAPYVLAVAGELRELDRELRIVVAGHQNDEPYVSRSRELGNIELVGYQQSRELAALMRGSVALLFLNRYETFGLGAVEAMAAGTPVIGTHFTAVPEVVGGAGLLVDPDRPREVAEQVVALARSPGMRQGLIEQGKRRAAQFTWEACVDRLLSALTGVTVGRGTSGGAPHRAEADGPPAAARTGAQAQEPHS